MERYKRFFEDAPYDYRKKYREFNKKYFNNELTKSLKFVTFSSDKSMRGSDGSVIATATGDHTISFYLPKWESLSEKDKDAVLIHEMIHIYVAHKGLSNKGNIHQGEFILKAKEIEKVSGLNLRGRYHKTNDDLVDKYKDADKKIVYAVAKNLTYRLMKKNLSDIEFFSTLEKAKAYAEDGRSYTQSNYHFFIYKIQTNSPVQIDHEWVSKYLDNNKGWLLTPQSQRTLLDKIQKNPEYAEFVMKIPNGM